MIKTIPEKRIISGVDALKAVQAGVQQSLGKKVTNVDISFEPGDEPVLRIEVDIVGNLKGPKVRSLRQARTKKLQPDQAGDSALGTSGPRQPWEE